MRVQTWGYLPGATVATKQVTPQTWAKALLQSMHLPTTPGNVAVIEEWEAREGGHWLNTAKFNPLNTTQMEPGASSINSVNVRAYTSWQQGLAATRQTLTNGLYDPILRALKTGNDKAAIRAISASPWAGSGGYHTWPSVANGRAYAAAHASPTSSSINVKPQPITLQNIIPTANVTTPGKGGSSLNTWIAANVVLIIIVAVAVLVLKRK